jgi:protein ImuB
MQWIAIHLPQLPLEICGLPTPEPCAITHGGCVLACDPRAAARGVRPGLAIPAACALVPNLIVRERDPAGETEALIGLAGWAAQFTPSVALEFPAALVLEVEGSRALFGGVEQILAALHAGLADMGYSARIAGGPTAKSAAWFARAGRESVFEPGALRAAVADLPVEAITSEVATLEALAAIGATTIGDVLRLPREGVARRFDRQLLGEIDRALGRLPDPRTFFTPPPRFHARLELPAEVTQAEMLLFAARRLLVQLAGFLAARASGVQRFVLRLFHREQCTTEIAIGLVAASRDAEHFVRLLHERLGAATLREPVRAIALVAEDIAPLAGEPLALFSDPAQAHGDWARLVERLRARLGASAVHSVTVTAEHRPERASRSVAPVLAQQRRPSPAAGVGPAGMDRGAGIRPFWLLPRPQPLEERGAVPYRGGPFVLLAGPERIESGWWDGGEIARDYFIARTGDQALVWVFRERPALQSTTRSPARGDGWYLHGLFA